MRISGNKEDKKKEVISERTTIFKLNDGTWKRGFLVNEATTLRESIEGAQRIFQGRYAGAYDFCRFKLNDGEVIEIISKFSYEAIWKMWTERGGRIGQNEYVWGFEFVRGDEEWNKSIMILSMLLAFREDRTVGTGNSKLDGNLAHDYILTSLARMIAGSSKKSPKERSKAISRFQELIGQYDLPKNEADELRKIISSISGSGKL